MAIIAFEFRYNIHDFQVGQSLQNLNLKVLFANV
jgi:hypothetical protein